MLRVEHVALVVAVLVVAGAAGTHARPTLSRAGSTPSFVPPPRWGGNNNTLAFTAGVNMTDQHVSASHPNWRFMYRYNWNLRASRYDHDQGQRDEVCAGMPGQAEGDPCTVLNAGNSVLYLMYPTTGYARVHKYCCNCSHSFTIRSDWLQDGGTTFLGEATYNGYQAYEWLKYGSEANHYLATTDDSRRPVRYYEYKGTALKQWDFVEYEAGAPDPSYFQEPSCGHVLCPSTVCEIMRKEVGPGPSSP